MLIGSMPLTLSDLCLTFRNSVSESIFLYVTEDGLVSSLIREFVLLLFR